MVTVDEVVPSALVSTWLGPFPLNDAETPAGPEKVKETVWAKLFADATYRFRVPADPCGMDMLALESAREKSPAVCAAAPFNDREASVTTKTTTSMEVSNRP